MASSSMHSLLRQHTRCSHWMWGSFPVSSMHGQNTVTSTLLRVLTLTATTSSMNTWQFIMLSPPNLFKKLLKRLDYTPLTLQPSAMKTLHQVMHLPTLLRFPHHSPLISPPTTQITPFPSQHQTWRLTFYHYYTNRASSISFQGNGSFKGRALEQASAHASAKLHLTCIKLHAYFTT